MQVVLDYPEEYLTSVHGYYLSYWCLPTYILSLTFKSNKRTYGPFGSEDRDGKYFSIEVPRCKIVGFHGRSDELIELRSIGAYLKPLDQKNKNHHPSKAVAHITYTCASSSGTTRDGYAFNKNSINYVVKYSPEPPRPPPSKPTVFVMGNPYQINPHNIDEKPKRRISYIVSGNEVIRGNEGNHDEVIKSIPITYMNA